MGEASGEDLLGQLAVMFVTDAGTQLVRASPCSRYRGRRGRLEVGPQPPWIQCQPWRFRTGIFVRDSRDPERRREPVEWRDAP